MRTKVLFAGAALAVLVSGGAYAQTPVHPCCPTAVGRAMPAESEGLAASGVGRAKPAESEGLAASGVGRAKPAESEGFAADHSAKLAESDGTVDTGKLAANASCQPCE